MKSITSTATLFLLVLALPDLKAQTVTFEPDAAGRLPDGTAVQDNLPITNQFLTFGVIFGLDNNLDGVADTGASPFLERIGGDEDDGFLYNFTNELDATASGLANQLGNYFLRTRALASAGASLDALLVSYTSPVAVASGEIWDLDSDATLGTEQWRIEALNSSGVVVGTVESPVGVEHDDAGTLDGRPWSFEVFPSSGNSISAIRFRFIGTKANGVGLAFNNFSPASQSPTVVGELEADIFEAAEIAWVAKVGKLYQVQWASSLGAPTWNNLGAEVDGIGAEVSIFDSTRSVTRRFYRVVELE